MEVCAVKGEGMVIDSIAFLSVLHSGVYILLSAMSKELALTVSRVLCSGLVDSNPIMSGLDENDEELSQLSGGVEMLIYGMVGWLSVVTVAALFIFVGVYVRMSRMARSLDDAETGSSISSKSSR